MLETLTFLLSHISQTFKIKENRIFKQKTREKKDKSYRDRVRRLPRRKAEDISSWREKEEMSCVSHFYFSLCHYSLNTGWHVSTSTCDVWVPGHAIVCICWPTLWSLSPRLADWHPTLASRARTIRVAVAAGIFSPGPGSAPHSTPVHSSALAELSTDLPWRTTEHGSDQRERGEDGHWCRPQVCLCVPTWLGTASWHGHGCLPGWGQTPHLGN